MPVLSLMYVRSSNSLQQINVTHSLSDAIPSRTHFLYDVRFLAVLSASVLLRLETSDEKGG